MRRFLSALNLPAIALPTLVTAGFGLALIAGPASAADLDYGYAPLSPEPVERVYERPVVVERPVVIERPVVVARPFYRPFYRPYGYYRPYRGFYGPRFAYGPRPYGWYR